MSLFAKKVNVVLDTNALLLFGQGIDVFTEIERLFDVPVTILIPELVIAEAQTLAQRTSKEGKDAKLGLALVREKERRQTEGVAARLFLPRAKEIPLKIVQSSGHHHADDAIFAIAEDEPAGTAVVTVDKGLQRRLLKRRVRVLGVQQHRLAFIE